MASNASRVKAYQLIQPIELGMSGFVEQLLSRPAWQEIVELIEQGKIEEAEAKAQAIREKREHN